MKRTFYRADEAPVPNSGGTPDPVPTQDTNAADAPTAKADAPPEPAPTAQPDPSKIDTGHASDGKPLSAAAAGVPGAQAPTAQPQAATPPAPQPTEQGLAQGVTLTAQQQLIANALQKVKEKAGNGDGDAGAIDTADGWIKQVRSIEAPENEDTTVCDALKLWQDSVVSDIEQALKVIL